jgi:sensor histidine kinase YesM
MESGLPSNVCYNIMQDGIGYIWIGNEKGLCRYSGQTFEQYQSSSMQGSSLSNIVEINGTIWCQDFSGNFYKTHQGKLVKTNSYLRPGGYSFAYKKNNNTLIYHIKDSIYVINTLNNSQKSFYTGCITYTANTMINNKYYYAHKKGIQAFDGNSSTAIFKYQQDVPDLFYLINTSTGLYGINKFNGINIYKFTDKEVQKVYTNTSGSFLQDVSLINNEVWLATSAGAICFDEAMKPKYNGNLFFKKYAIARVIRDRENAYWFTTSNNGIIYVPDINTQLINYEEQSITALATYNYNEVLAGTSREHIFKFNTSNGTITPVFTSGGKGQVVNMYVHPNKDEIIASGSMLNVIKNNKLAKQVLVSAKHIIPINATTYVSPFSNGFIYFTSNGSMPVKPAYIKASYNNTQNIYYHNEGFRGRSVYYNQGTNTIYYAGANGLLMQNAEAINKPITYQGKPIYASWLAGIDTLLFAATYNTGLLAITPSSIINYNSIAKNLPVSINKLYMQNDTLLWIIGDKQLLRLNLKHNNTDDYTGAIGRLSGEVKDIIINNNKLIVGATQGLIVCDLNKYTSNTNTPNLVINNIFVNGKLQTSKQLTALKAHEQNIEINLSLLTYKDADNSSIEFKINDKPWQILPKGIRTVLLNSLASGKYTLSIRGKNSAGIITANNIVLLINIATPWYKVWWVWLLIIAGIIASIFWYFNRQMQQQKIATQLNNQKIQLEKELHKSTLASIKSQMNPHFIFNALNTIQSYIYTSDKEKASVYLGKFSDLTRKILEMSNTEVITLHEEVAALKLYLELEAMRFSNKLNYTIAVEPQISSEGNYLPSMLVQPYVENAIKHGLLHRKAPWQLDITISKQLHNLIVRIDDNGIGRQRSEEINKNKFKHHQSFASSANEKRLDIINQGRNNALISLQIIDKKDQQGQASGTTIIINIPQTK